MRRSSSNFVLTMPFYIEICVDLLFVDQNIKLVINMVIDIIILDNVLS